VGLPGFPDSERVLEPVKRLDRVSERLSAGDYRTRASIDVADDLVLSQSI